MKELIGYIEDSYGSDLYIDFIFKEAEDSYIKVYSDEGTFCTQSLKDLTEISNLGNGRVTKVIIF